MLSSRLGKLVHEVMCGVELMVVLLRRALCATFPAPFISDRFGRRVGIFVGSAITLAGAITQVRPRFPTSNILLSDASWVRI